MDGAEVHVLHRAIRCSISGTGPYHPYVLQSCSLPLAWLTSCKEMSGLSNITLSDAVSFSPVNMRYHGDADY